MWFGGRKQNSLPKDERPVAAAPPDWPQPAWAQSRQQIAGQALWSSMPTHAATAMTFEVLLQLPDLRLTTMVVG